MMHETIARVGIIASLVALGIGTIGGSSPSIPNSFVYAIAAWVTAGLWVVATFEREDRIMNELADAALLSLAIMRASGYLYDLIVTGRQSLFAAVAAWVIVAALVARPFRHAT